MTVKNLKMIAVACYFHDKREFGLWKYYRCFNELPDLIQEIYIDEAKDVLVQHGVL